MSSRGDDRAAGVRRRARQLLLGSVVVLYVVSIPWYRDSDATPAIVLGLPDWVLVAVVCYVGAAVATAAAWLLTDVRDDGDPR